MNTVNVSLITFDLHEVGMALCAVTMARVGGHGGSPMVGPNLQRPLQAIFQLQGHFERNGLYDLARVCKVAIEELARPMQDASSVQAVLMAFTRSVIEKLEKLSFVFVDEPQAKYLDNDKLFGEKVYDSFPSAREI